MLDMKNERNITAVLLFVLLLAIIIQLVRSDTLFKLQKNTYAQEHEAAGMVTAIPRDEINQKERDTFGIIIHSSDKNSILLKNQLSKALRHMKKDFEIIDAAFINNINKDYGSFVICVRDLDLLRNMDEIIDYAYGGGSILFAVSPELDSTYYRIYRKMGIADGGEIVDAPGIKLISDVMIKGKNTAIGRDFISNTAITAALDNKATLHATSIDGLPLLWEVPYGNGKIVVFNGTMLNEKRSRGLFSAAVTLLKDTYIYPILNIRSMFIDDFPAPLPDDDNALIKEKYNRSVKAFIRDVWWPDMLRIGAAYGLRYTGVAIMSYDNIVAPPFLNNSRVDTLNMKLYGKELLQNGGELGMHGYNHQSLVIKGDFTEKYTRDVLGYNIFNSVDDVSESIRSFLSIFNSIYQNYVITCYVPPSNVLGYEARKTLKKELPGLETVASIYYNNLEEGSYDQEFEVAEDGVVEYPRLTYGFLKDELNDWAVLNGVNELGVVSHFCHPDDTLDIERNKGKYWDEMAYEFEGFFKMIEDKYPWLRNMTMTNAGRAAKSFLTAETFIDYRENEINGYINGMATDYYFILKTDKKAYAQKGCLIEKISDGTYLVCAREMKYTVGLKN